MRYIIALGGNRTPSETLEGFHVTTTPLTLNWLVREYQKSELPESNR